MHIEKVLLENYRIFRNREIEFGNGINLVFGKNSSGKTSLLESIFFTFSGEILNDFNPINYESNSARVQINFLSNEVYNQITLILKSKENKVDKLLYLNEKRIETFKEIREKFLCPFLMNTFDISFMEPENKRNIIDRFLKISDKEYGNLYYNFKRALRQKSNLLKRKVLEDNSIIESLDNKIAEYSAEISYKRASILRSILEDLNIVCRKIWKNIEQVRIIFSVAYGENIQIDQNMLTKQQLKNHYLQAIKTYKREEIDKERVLISSNRDNFEFLVVMANKSYPIKNIFSQSQINMFTLIFFLSLIKKIRQIYGYYPVVLLDEPFVFLDQTNTEKIIKVLNNYPQVIITSNRDIEIIKNRIRL
ncbi:MAG: AAA family ATPase [Candidatus Calescibacterium sp.]|nr:AAA family ATPase [Candidatus Calescibacterium sp.]MCX7972644.1 AAA family ATPase [bacterium]MDW8194759.1 AAA family ATPase [Candidatus Calescibacterium sp.]